MHRKNLKLIIIIGSNQTDPLGESSEPELTA